MCFYCFYGYTGLGAQTPVPKKHFSSFLFSVVCQKKNYGEITIDDFTMDLIISKWLRTQKCRQKRKTMRQGGQSKEEMWVFSFSLTQIVYTASCESFCTTCCTFSAQIAFFTRSQPFNFFIECIIFKTIIHKKDFFLIVSLNNLEDVLRRNLRKDRAKYCIFQEISGPTIFEIPLLNNKNDGFNVCTSLPKNLQINHCSYNFRMENNTSNKIFFL